MPVRQHYAAVDFIPQSGIYEFGYWAGDLSCCPRRSESAFEAAMEALHQAIELQMVNLSESGFQQMRVSEEPVCIYLFRQNPFI